MTDKLLVAAHVSTLNPTIQLSSHPITTSRKNAPLASAFLSQQELPEHAAHSSVLHTPTTGTILLRVLHGGLILELSSLSASVEPLRFIFPAPVLSFPNVFLSDNDHLHLLAVTVTASLYRIVVPIGPRRQLWQDQPQSHWYHEYLIENLPDRFQGLVHIHGTHSIAIAVENGDLLRIEADSIDDEGDQWEETLLRPNSRFFSFSSLLPSGSTPAGSEIVAMTTYPWPTDISHVWTLSRDRTIRLWKPKLGCVASKAITSSSKTRESTPAPDIHPNAGFPINPVYQTCLRVFSTVWDDQAIFALVFISTPTSSTSPGFFHLLRTEADHLYDVTTIPCSADTVSCHLQDFYVVGTKLYVLWDRNGESCVEHADLLPYVSTPSQPHYMPHWTMCSYAPAPELTPTYLEELLLSLGSMAAKFLEATMRPGMFSSLTIRIALEQYVEACLSLPGPPPPQLTLTYASQAEHIAAVVGCTVNLQKDPHTGALQHTNYWNALKRDWEGFIARCRHIERSARWPLVLGVDEESNVIVIERERVGFLVDEDLPLCIYRGLMTGQPAALRSPEYALLDILWNLRSKIGSEVMSNVESRLVDIIHQEIAFSLADILHDQAVKSNFKDEMDEGLEIWIAGRLQSVPRLDNAVRTTIDVICGFDVEVKREEDQVELLLPQPSSEWERALASAYITASISARYELCLCLLLLLFFISEDLPHWDPALLAETLAVFRGVAMLRQASRRPAKDSPSALHQRDRLASSDDAIVARLREMQVSQNRANSFTPSHSLIHRLLAQSSDDVHHLPSGAHRFLDSVGLFQLTSLANATRFEVVFCERLRLMGYGEIAREMLAWLPRTPAVTYVLARLWLSIGRADDASHLFDKLAASFGEDRSLVPDDEEALAAVLPNAQLFNSDYSFYVFVSSLFSRTFYVEQEVKYAQLALSVVPDGSDTLPLWHSIIKGYIDIGLFEDGYASLMAMPNDKSKKDYITHLVYCMCEENAVEQLMTFNFAGFADDVEAALSFKARNVDPRSRPFYSRILYTWYVQRGDYRNAASTMYQRAQKIRHLSSKISDPSLAPEELEAYLFSINALALMDEKNAWVVLPSQDDVTFEPRKRRKFSTHIPETKYAPGKHDAEIIDIHNIRYDYALLSARTFLASRQSVRIQGPGEYLLPPASVILRLIQANQFNMAMATARSLGTDMTELFGHLTTQCLQLSKDPSAIIAEDASDWLLTDNVSSWPGTTAERGWRYLRQALERHDNSDTDHQYSKAAFETIVAFDRSAPPPPWLVRSLELHHPEYLIRTALRYELFDLALEQTLGLLRNTDSQFGRAQSMKHASSTWLPYNLIDEVLVAVAGREDGLSESIKSLRQQVKAELDHRVKRVGQLSQELS